MRGTRFAHLLEFDNVDSLADVNGGVGIGVKKGEPYMKKETTERRIVTVPEWEYTSILDMGEHNLTHTLDAYGVNEYNEAYNAKIVVQASVREGNHWLSAQVIGYMSVVYATSGSTARQVTDGLQIVSHTGLYINTGIGIGTPTPLKDNSIIVKAHRQQGSDVLQIWLENNAQTALGSNIDNMTMRYYIDVERYTTTKERT